LNRAREDDGISIQEQYEPYGREAHGREAQSKEPAERSNRSQAPNSNARPEMKGPSDIGDLLSGLKTKTINVPPQQQSQPQKQQVNSMKQNINSVNSNTNLNQATNNIAKFSDLSKSKPRKQKSDRNTMSLDI